VRQFVGAPKYFVSGAIQLPPPADKLNAWLFSTIFFLIR